MVRPGQTLDFGPDLRALVAPKNSGASPARRSRSSGVTGLRLERMAIANSISSLRNMASSS